jgi:integrase
VARQYERLTARQAATINQPGMHPDGGGLYLFVGKGGSKSWIVRYAFHGKRHDIGLGPVRLVSLADARRKMADLARQRLDGADPLLERRAKRHAAAVQRANALTFAECADLYIDAQAAGWRAGSGQEQQWRNSLRDHALPTLGALPVAAIDTGLVMRTIEGLWRTKPETASRVRGRIESILGWATVRGYRTGDNPARWGGHLENLLPSRSRVAPIVHHEALPYGELPGFMVELHKQTGIAARAFEFVILTAARIGEVLGARWGEFDLAAKVWSVPGERRKAGRPHTVPLSDRGVELLGKPGAAGDLVFPGSTGREARKQILYRVQAAIGWPTPYTLHGFRSTFRDWAGDQTAFPREITETALAHAVGNAVEQAYRRSSALEQRRQLMDAWARYCDQPAIEGNNVVAIRSDPIPMRN